MIPFNFVVGAAVGVASTYVYKDEKAKQWLTDTTTKIKQGVSSFVATVTKKADAPAAEVTATVTPEAPAAEPIAEVVVTKVEEPTNT